MQGTTATAAANTLERSRKGGMLLGRTEERSPVEADAIESTVEKIRVSRLAFGHGKVPKPHFDLGADLQEMERRSGVLQLKFVLYLDTFPSVQRIEMHGVATVRSSRFTLRDDNLESLDEGFLGDVAMEIFRNHYESVYLLFDSMGLVAPSPWVVKDVYLV